MPNNDETRKPVHTIILDTAPILLNTPSISTLQSQCESLVISPSVVSEIKGEEARNRFETLYKPFITIRSPKPETIKLVRDFARKTGDLAVLSQTDLEVLALAYDLECERNEGDWRLRSTPGQKRLNGKPPEKKTTGDQTIEDETQHSEAFENSTTQIAQDVENLSLQSNVASPPQKETQDHSDEPLSRDAEEVNVVTSVVTDTETNILNGVEQLPIEIEEEEISGSESDEGWITPSNIKRQKAKDANAQDSTEMLQGKILQVATMTGDFAMQNVLLQMNLNLLSTKTCQRIGHIKQMIFRCHACFATTKDMSKQFCPRCGKPTLTRVTCTTNDRGEVKLHLKSNFQWNNRGNVYSIPKPVSGSANQKWQGAKHGGGKDGWGSDLILAEDQKEYVRAMSQMQRSKQKDLMDEDTLPSIFSGARDRSAGKVQVGAGRNVNRRKR